MKLLRNSVLLGALRRLVVGRRAAARPSYVVTVPAPRTVHADNVVALRPLAPAVEVRQAGGMRRHPSGLTAARVVNL